MSREVRHTRKLAAGAIAVLVLAGASTSSAASTDDPFDHTPKQVDCNASDVYVVLSPDTTKITGVPPGTVAFDFVGLCGTTPPTGPPAAVIAPSSDVEPAVVAADLSQPTPASAVAAQPQVTG